MGHAVLHGLIETGWLERFQPHHQPPGLDLQGRAQLARLAGAQHVRQDRVGLHQGHRPHHPPGGLLHPFGVGGGQLGKVGLPFRDAEVELIGQRFTAHPQQAVDHRVELLFATEKTLLRPVEKVGVAMVADAQGQLGLPEGIGSAQPG